MREIKFRAWDRNQKRFVTYGYLGHDGLYYSGEGCEIYGSDEHVEAQMFTGLKDKKGKEIYEGDILKLESWVGTQQVAFIEGAFCLADKDGNYVGDIHYIHHAGIMQSEIIGNIYENPELIK